MYTQAILALEDGNIFLGRAIGAQGECQGEVVFNTAMTGYQEILTDPSYTKQIVTLTTPHIGNTGTNAEDVESNKVAAAGLIIKELSLVVSNWRNQMTLGDYCQAHQLVAIAEIDTRRLTCLLREKGALRGVIISGDNLDKDAAIAKARQIPLMTGQDLSQQVTCREKYSWRQGTWHYPEGYRSYDGNQLPHKIVVIDYGVKYNILRYLVAQGCDVTVVPATTTLADLLALKPVGVVLSNGPGDPAASKEAIKLAQALFAQKIPLLGICLGFQILMLAAGAKTYKMKFGHHGANHPVKNLQTDRVSITSQNHGFAIDSHSLPDNVEITHRSLFDNSLQGVRFNNLPVMGFQGHPEASPGPHDIDYLFREWIELCQNVTI